VRTAIEETDDTPAARRDYTDDQLRDIAGCRDEFVVPVSSCERVDNHSDRVRLGADAHLSGASASPVEVTIRSTGPPRTQRANLPDQAAEYAADHRR
jgi:hypothetical protein